MIKRLIYTLSHTTAASQIAKKIYGTIDWETGRLKDQLLDILMYILTCELLQRLTAILLQITDFDRSIEGLMKNINTLIL